LEKPVNFSKLLKKLLYQVLTERNPEY